MLPHPCKMQSFEWKKSSNASGALQTVLQPLYSVSNLRQLWIASRHPALSNFFLYAPLIRSYDRMCALGVGKPQ
jgi:hypothetical protein